MAERRVVETEGQRLFDQFIRDHGLTLEAVGDALGVSGVTVMNWRKGFVRPVDPERTKIEVYTGIPAPTWRTPEECEEIRRVRPFTSTVAA